MMLFEVMMAICGAKENENIRLGRVGWVRIGLGYDVYLFAPEMNIIFGISTSNNLRINNIYA